MDFPDFSDADFEQYDENWKDAEYEEITENMESDDPLTMAIIATRDD